jgi:hypothetical protein
VSQNDPTDNALAAIASILELPPVIPRERERPAVESAPATPPPLEVPPSVEAPPSLAAPPPIEAPAPLEAPPPEVAAPLVADGYSRIGPGPMAAIRFKWTVREDHGDYYVDETIGEHSTPVVNGPMNKDDAIRMVDDRAADARHRFDQLKGEMTGRAAAANLARKDSGEA